MFGGGYVYTPELAARGRALEKQRESMFGANSAARQEEEQKTKEYRLKDRSEQFSATSNSTEMLLTQQTVGLVSKEEYGRRKREVEEGVEPPAAAEGEASKPKKKKKSKEKAGALSFAMDDEGDEGGAEAEAALPKKPKKNPNVDFVPELAKEAEAAPAEPLSKPAPKESAAPITGLPAGASCVRLVGEAPCVLELSLEVFASASAPKTKIDSISAQSISMTVQGSERENQANVHMCSFLRSVLGGNAVTAEVVRGHKAPVKAVKIMGVDSADLAYHRLLMAHKAIK